MVTHKRDETPLASWRRGWWWKRSAIVAILSGDTQLTVLEEGLPRSNGTFTSRQPIQVPTDLLPGLYTLRGSVSTGEKQAVGSALFEVVDNGAD